MQTTTPTTASALQAQFDDHLTQIGPDIRTDEYGNVHILWSSNNDGHPEVLFKLIDTENPLDDGRLVYDLHISIDNCDNVGAREMVRQTNACLDQFYAMGLHTRFGFIVGEDE